MKRSPKTVRGWAAKYRRDMKAQIGAHAAAATDFRMEIARLKRSLRAAQEGKSAWSDYDRAVDATTSAEMELFKASPAYRKYQEFRRQRVLRDSMPKAVGKARGFSPTSGRTPPT